MTQNSLSIRHLLGIQHLTAEDIEIIFKTADEFKEVINRPIKKVPSLRDVTIANLFFENSTRTRISFELAEKRLSADVVNFSASSSSVKKRGNPTRYGSKYTLHESGYGRYASSVAGSPAFFIEEGGCHNHQCRRWNP